MTHIYARSEKELLALLAISDAASEPEIQQDRCLSGDQMRTRLRLKESATA